MSGPRVSVIIPVYRDWADAAGCARALAAQTRPADEVLFVNNDPGTPAPADFPLPPGGVILTEAAPGSYAARNRALGLATGDLLFFTDADCRPEPDWIATGLAAFADPAVQRVAGGITLDTRGPRPGFVECYDLLTAFRPERSVAHGWAVTANMAARRAVFDRVGGFDAGLLSGGDQDWGKRAARAGVALTHLPAMRVHHPARASWAGLARKTRRVEGAKAVQLLAKRGRARALAAYLPALPFRLLPHPGATLALLGRRGVPARQRLNAALILWALRLVRASERGRILICDAAPERR